jgi:hypothetical protein
MCCLLQFPEEPDETLDGISATDVPKIEPNVVRMDLAGGFAMQKIGPNRMFFRYQALSWEPLTRQLVDRTLT